MKPQTDPETLSPTSSDPIEDVFGDEGYLSRAFDGYAKRPSQIEMSRAVEDAIAHERVLLVEAPTGTGKSIAYSVPAIQAIQQDRLRVVLVTANIALQEQLVGKDLPTLAEILPYDFSYALRKGLSNYACKFAADEVVVEGDSGDLAFSENSKRRSESDLREIEEIREWLSSTATGDKSELDFRPSASVWADFSTGTDDCLGKDCPFYHDCYGKRAQAEIRNVDVVVCNYHVFFADQKVKWASGGHANVIGEYDVVIFDEAHKAPEIARDFFGISISKYRAKGPLSRLSEIQGGDYVELRATLVEQIDRLFDGIRAYESSDRYDGIRLRDPEYVDQDLAAEILDGYRRAVDAYEDELDDLKRTENARDLSAQEKRLKGRVQQSLTSLSAFMSDFVNAITLANDRQVYFLERRKSYVKVVSKRVFVDDVFEAILEDIPSAIFTSATLSVGGTFDYFAKELGVEDYDGLEVGTPFNYQDNVLLVVPDLPAPNDDRWRDAVSDTFLDVVERVGGRTLGLFTSYRNLNLTKEALRRRTSFRVAAQGERPRTKLAEDFRDDVDSVLLGTESFWAGVDVPGESNSCVVIDRLPFPHYSDPVIDAIRETNDNWFFEYSVPRAIVQFKQGFGRLIRRIGDYGVVVVLDNRIIEKSYGSSFTRSLPKVMKTRDLEKIDGFFAWKRERLARKEG